MGKISKTHFRPYKEPADLQSHIDVLQVVIAALRDSELTLSSKKRMLNHALWEISHARGNFAPEFRSISVVRSLVGTKIERDHVYTAGLQVEVQHFAEKMLHGQIVSAVEFGGAYRAPGAEG
jgi:hypothetical protein